MECKNNDVKVPETSAHVINHMLLQFVIEHVLFFVRFPVGEL